MKTSVLICCLMLCRVAIICAQQTDSTREKVQQELENALESFDPTNPDLNTQRLTEILEDLAQNPLNINEAEADKLLFIPGVNLKIAKAIVHYRTHVKPFGSVDELLKVKGIGDATLERMRPYVKVGSGFKLAKNLFMNYHYWTHEGHAIVFSRYQQKLQRSEGFKRPYSDGGYLGSPVKYYQRFEYHSKHLSMDLTQQKDAGEPFSGKAGFDHTVWNVALHDNGKLRNLVIGNYALYFGQGLVLWNGRTFGKGRDVIGAANRSERGIAPYSSSGEFGYFRGVAATYGRKVQVTGFYSNRKTTASRVSENERKLPTQNGYHRTANERSDLNDLRQTLYGGHIKVSLPFGYIGVTGYQTAFNKYIVPGKLLSQRYDFGGRKNSVFGADYNLIAGPAILFGEAARSKNGAWGVIAGLQSPLGNNTDMTLAYRNYAKNFQSFLGSGFGEQSGKPQNESGLYVGLRHTITKRVTFSAYFDQFSFPAPRYQTREPTKGHDWLGLLQAKLNPELSFYIQARHKTRGEDYTIQDRFGRDQIRLGNAQRSSLRGQMQYQVNPEIRLRTRLEGVRNRQAGAVWENGYLVYQDVQFVAGPKLTIYGRVTVFDTDSYATRIYQFENDLLYVLSDKMLYGEGERMYAVVDYRPLSFLEVWAKFGITTFENQQTISSGLNQIQGNHKSHAGVEVRLRF
jgi:competence ComEA-like helix-hairpin-helix protein